LDITPGELIVWVIVGALAGSLAGALVTRKKEGFGRVRNLALGMGGAVLGGLLVDLLRIDLGLGALRVEFEDVLAAFVGSLLLIVVIWLIKRRAKRGAAKGL
jgi:uncharacterized membrane protein YeaQ/YmgE (transglycosylase-associated protein family)